jgi:PAS domain S-box-containing protein
MAMAALLLALPVVPAAAAPPPIASAAEIDYPPFSIVEENGSATGFAVELLRASLAAMNREVAFRTGTWDQVRGLLEQGEIEALPLVGRTPERETLFDFTFPYMALHGAIVVRKDNTDIRNIGDLRGRQVAVMKGDNAEEFLRREDHGILIHTTATFEQALAELSQGRHDAVVVQRIVALRLIQQTGLTDLRVVEKPVEGFRQDWSFAVKEGDRDTLSLLNEGLSIVMADGTYRHLHAKWFAALELPSDRPILIGGERDYPPFEYIDENGRPAGFTVDLTRAIAREMNLEIQIRLGPWPGLIEQLKTGQIDAIQGIFYSPKRDLALDFTSPYIVHHYVAIARRDKGLLPESFEALAGRKLAAQQDDIILEILTEKGLAGQITMAPNPEEVLRAVVEGRADIALALRTGALHLIEKNGWHDLVLSKQAFYSADYCYAVANGHSALLAQFSEGLNILEHSGEYRRIHEKWFGALPQTPPTLIMALRYSLMVIGPLVLLLLGFLLWSWSLRRQVAAKTGELRESMAQFKFVFEAANVGKSITLPSGEVNANKAFAEFLGYTPEELKGKSWREITPAEDIEETEKVIDRLLSGERNADRFEKRYIHKSGRILWADVSVTLRRDKQGRPLHFVTTIVDITEQKRAQESLRSGQELQRATIACSPLAIYSIDLQGNVLLWNDAAQKIFGWAESEVIGRFLPVVPEAQRKVLGTLRAELLKQGAFSGREVVLQCKDGRLFHASLSAAPIHDSTQAVIGIMSSVQDITEQKRSQEELQRSEALLNAAQRISKIGGWEWNVARREMFWTEETYRLHDFDPEDFPPDGQTHITRSVACYSEQDRLKILSSFERCVAQGTPYELECRFTTTKGRSLWIRTAGLAVVEQGQVVKVFGYIQDITAQKQAEQEHERLQAQLIQAQKMESVGRLAGGVAHDYNNILSVILGYAELALAKLETDHPIHEHLRQIYAAGCRSRDITRQLLAFARKEVIAPEVLDLNATVESMLKILRRLIGEDIDLAWLPKTGLWPALMDPSQIDQILANLCVNARDAITGVGKIIIETDIKNFDDAYCAGHPGFAPGDFVLLSVSDSGCGMDKPTLDKIFDPFFTTKGVGIGTGLGLAMVYGIVKQNNGFINVYSEPGKGSTFKIYLPRHLGEIPVEPRPISEEIPMGNGETVLVVEDEITILQMTETILSRLNYKVIAAQSPSEALTLAETHGGKILILVTDVVMPEMNGRELAERMRTLFPGLKCLYMSGYTADVILHRGGMDKEFAFIQKPFSRRDLAIKVREALGAG